MYIGNNLYNRTSFKLKQRHVRNQPNIWVRKERAFEPLVPVDWFSRVQAIMDARAQRFDDDTMIFCKRSTVLCVIIAIRTCDQHRRV